MSQRYKGPAPPAPGPNTDIVRVSWTQPKTLIVYSTNVTCSYVHWYSNRSHECFGPHLPCERCKLSQPRKWKGYLHVSYHTNGRGFFLEITPTFDDLLAAQVGRENSLRGVMMKVCKTAGGAKGRFIVEVLACKTDEANMVVERDPLPILKMLWDRNSGPSQKDSASL